MHRSELPSDDPWWPLYDDLRKRLEQTPVTYWLRIAFASADLVAAAQQALSQLFAERLGDNQVVIQRFASDPDHLYVQRGARYSLAGGTRRRGAKLSGDGDDED